MKRVLTGLQPTGKLTLGNYIGAIRPMIKNQDEYESIMFIADMHAITVPQDPNKLRENIKNLLAIYLACGIDPNKNTIFLQSDNIYHANVSWILECLTPYGELSRMTQFKDKSLKNQNFSAGLLTYPVLMASDILIYDVDYVPVGQDQKQHVELTRNIAERVNKKYKEEIFKIPTPLIIKNGAKIMDLVDPTKKMSKSTENQNGVIYLLDDEEVIRKKIMSAKTDSESIIKYDEENKPGISNLMTIYSVLENISIEAIEEKYKDANYGTFKKDVAESVIKNLKEIKTNYEEIIKDDSVIEKILEDGKNKTTKIAEEKYNKLKNIVGLSIK